MDEVEVLNEEKTIEKNERADSLDRLLAAALRDAADVPPLSAAFGIRLRRAVRTAGRGSGGRWKIAASLVLFLALATVAAVAVLPRIVKVGSGECVTFSMVPEDVKRIDINGGTVTVSSGLPRPLGDATVRLSDGGRLKVAPQQDRSGAWTGSVDSVTYARGANAIEISRGDGSSAVLALGSLTGAANEHGTLVIAAGGGSAELGGAERVTIPGWPPCAILDPRLVTRDLGQVDAPFYFLGYDAVRGFHRLSGVGGPETISSNRNIRETMTAKDGLYIRAATNLSIAAGQSLRLGNVGADRPVGVSISIPSQSGDGRVFQFRGGGIVDFGDSDGCFWAHARSATWNVGAQYGRWVSFRTPVCGNRSVTFAGYATDVREYVTYDLGGCDGENVGRWRGPTYVSGCRLQIGPTAWNGGLPWSDLHILGGVGVRAAQLQLAGDWGTRLRQNLHLAGKGPDGFFGGAVHIVGGSPVWTFDGSVELADDALFFHDNPGCRIVFRGPVYGVGRFIQGNGSAEFRAENAYSGGTELTDPHATVDVLTNATLGTGPVAVKAGRLRIVGGRKTVPSLELGKDGVLDLCGGELTAYALSGEGTVTNSLGGTATLIVGDGEAFRGTLAAGVRTRVAVRRGREWIPFDNLKRIEPGSALDFSGEGFLDAPAGKHGWLVNADGHFEFEGRPGKPVRLNGVNLCGEAALPKDARTASAALERFERLGYNTLRLHHVGGPLAGGTADRMSLDPERTDRFDRFVAAAIARGFYLTIDLHSDRPVTWADIGLEGKGVCGEFRTLVNLHEPAFSNWCGYACNLMTHVNPYTRRRYADEPALALVCLVNEGHPLWTWDSALRQVAPVRTAWRAWLRERRAADPDYAKGVSEEAKEVSGWGTPALQIFHGEMEARTVRRQRAFLRSLGCRALLTNQNCGDHITPLQRARADEYDYVDDHLYTDHPKFTGSGMWQPPSTCRNLEPVNTGKVAAAVCAWTRVPGKPMCITEWSHSGPAPRRGAGGLLVGAMAAVQEWDALWQFAYSHTENGLTETASGWPGYFSTAGDPIALATGRAVACLFMRGDLPSAKDKVMLTLTPEVMRPDNRFAWGIRPPWWQEAWNVQVGVGNAAMPGWRALPLDSERWNRRHPPVRGRNPYVAADPTTGVFRVTTPRTAGGYLPKGGTLTAGPLTFLAEGNRPVTLWASVVGGHAPLASADRILVTHLTDAQGENTVFTDDTHGELWRWGGGRILLRRGRAEVALAVEEAAACEAWALDASGKRRVRLPGKVGSDGRFVFTVDVEQPFGGCLCYEISRKTKGKER